METNDKMPLYIVDSCPDKVGCQTFDACLTIIQCAKNQMWIEIS